MATMPTINRSCLYGNVCFEARMIVRVGSSVSMLFLSYLKDLNSVMRVAEIVSLARILLRYH